MIYKFVSWEATPKTEEEAYQTHYGKLMARLEAGDTTALKECVWSELWHSDAYRSGIYKQGGWAFDFREYLHLYLVKDKYAGWREVYAPNKTTIRKNATFPSHIIRIIDAA